MMNRASLINARTLYAHYARLKTQAVAEILRLRKYLFPAETTTPENIGHYLVPVARHRAPLQLEIDQTIQTDGTWHEVDELQLRLENYIRRYERAVSDYQESVPWLNKLKSDNDVFLAPLSKRDYYLYMLDRETCEQASEVIGQPDGSALFSDKYIELKGRQTDAVRVWYENTVLDHLRIMDRREYGYDKAHRDAIQLIPPSVYKQVNTSGQQRRIKQLDPLSCSLLENVTVRNCYIRAENGPLQGIFASDGVHRNLKISGNTIATKGTHAISVSGVLSGCEFSNNTLRQVEGGHKPAITLYPARIGGNMADDGVLNILSFKSGSELYYGEFIDSENRLYDKGETTVLKVNDLRSEIPEQYKKFAAGLLNFDYETYRMQYAGWTVRDFQARDSFGYSRLQDWLEVREQEYRTGVRLDTCLPEPTPEQRALGANTVLGLLSQARKAVERNDADFRAMRLADLPYTPMRSFVMKRIAVRNSEIAPFEDLGAANDLRRAYLAYILSAKVLNSLLVREEFQDEEQMVSVDPAIRGVKPLAEGIV
ncbi:MAG: right-handed parallel beta-helix repeat-containing protein [Thiolinea sp.]